MYEQQPISDPLQRVIDHSARLSEESEPHYIAFAAGHAVLLRPSETPWNPDGLDLQDITYPDASGAATEALGRTRTALEAEIAVQGRAHFMFDASALAERSGVHLHNLVDACPWLIVGTSIFPVTQGFGNFFEDGRRQRPHHVQAMSVYNPGTGREVLQGYMAVSAALKEGDIDTAYQAFIDLPSWPDVDARSPHLTVHRLVRGLLAGQEFGKATTVIERYFGSLDKVSQHARFSAMAGELWFKVFGASGLAATQARAVSAYLEAARRSKYSSEAYAKKAERIGSLAAATSRAELDSVAA